MFNLLVVVLHCMSIVSPKINAVEINLPSSEVLKRDVIFVSGYKELY